MSFMGKLKFWKSEDSFEPLKPFGTEDFSMGKGLSSPSLSGKENDLGLGMDRSPGLAGTGNLSSMNRYGSEDNKVQNDVSLMGPAYDRPPESGDLRHAPLAPMERSDRSSGYSSGAAVNSRDIEMISAKLDAIRANMENINHRLESIERVVLTQERKRVQW
jgi:hypothetical protein